MRLEGIHHVTCVTADAPEQCRLLRAGARPADREEDGEPGRQDDLPHLLRRRARLLREQHQLLRVPRPARRPRGRRERAPIVWRVGGGRARLLGGAPRRCGARDPARRGHARLRRPRGPEPPARRRPQHGSPAHRRNRPRSPSGTPSRASTPFSLATDDDASAAFLTDVLGMAERRTAATAVRFAGGPARSFARTRRRETPQLRRWRRAARRLGLPAAGHRGVERAGEAPSAPTRRA